MPNATKCKVLADTYNPFYPSARITTFEIYAPRFLLAEINTHRIIAKSAQSSRAIPVAKRISKILGDPFIPQFGRNQPGMQAGNALSISEQRAASDEWMRAVGACADAATALAEKDVHKQWANRLLEPFAYFHGVLTATEWDNFWNLRCSPMAQPEFRELACMMHDAYLRSQPSRCTAHIPYCVEMYDDPQCKLSLLDLIKISAARCARVSYKNHDGSDFDMAKDLKLCDILIEQGHLSPFDHPAICDDLRQSDLDGKTYWAQPDRQRQFWGWIPYRSLIERDKGWKLARNSYEPITF